MKNQIVTITFFNYQGFRQKWNALTNMGLLPRKITKVAGLHFYKLMGSGKDGFSIQPNWGTYGLLAVWENRATAEAYFASPLFDLQKKQASTHNTHYLRAAQVRGQWDGRQPFELNGNLEEDQTIAVLTRASIKTRHVGNFWKDVPKVNQSLKQKDGRQFSIGLGELPLVTQATFSIWDSAAQMKRFAYNSEHQEVIAKTRERGYFKEELFARFEIVE